MSEKMGTERVETEEERFTAEEGEMLENIAETEEEGKVERVETEREERSETESEVVISDQSNGELAESSIGESGSSPRLMRFGWRRT